MTDTPTHDRPTHDHSLPSGVDCAICAAPLEYATGPVEATCDLCGVVERALITCPAGHYVCDACHGKAAMDVARSLLAATGETDPAVLAERLMALPSLTMHGPEHHALVPAVLVAAARNAGHPVGDDAVEKALERGGRVPGGWCGYYGACGAAVGVGVAVSVLTAATPLRGRERSLSLAATSAALARMLDDGPRCCKRATRVAIASGVEFLRENLAIDLPADGRVACAHSDRNAQCLGAACAYFTHGG